MAPHLPLFPLQKTEYTIINWQRLFVDMKSIIWWFLVQGASPPSPSSSAIAAAGKKGYSEFGQITLI